MTITSPHMAPHGEWKSPITAELAASGTTAGPMTAPQYVGIVGDEVWWAEPRAVQDGRMVLMRRRMDDAEGVDGADGAGDEGRAGGEGRAGREAAAVLPGPWNVRSRVIEYGGPPWTAAQVAGRLTVVFVHFDDQRLYAWAADEPGARPRPLTPLTPLTPLSPVGAGLRWVEPQIDPVRGVVRCVLEEFTGSGPSDLRRVIAAVPLDGSASADRSAISELTDDRHRFVTALRVSPDGSRAVWLAWDHPRMPWEGAQLKIAGVSADGTMADVRTLIGGPGDPIAQAEWAADGTLLVAAERTGWWNLCRVDPDSGQATALHPAREEFGGAQRLGLRWFVPLHDGRIAVLHGVGALRLAVLDPASGALADVPGSWSEWLPYLDADGDRFVGIAADQYGNYEVVEIDTSTQKCRAPDRARRGGLRSDYLPEPYARTFTGPDGRLVYANVYPPRNPEYQAPEGELPPYVVWAHGGPTLRAPLVPSSEIAYFTSRGLGVVDVNYAGSPGYGRDYRDRLRERWGVADVEDCTAVARALIDEEQAALGGIAIRGGSAGGFTAASCLVHSDVFSCATILYPLVDLYEFATAPTHDFESHYLEYLIGPLAEVPERYRERSLMTHAQRIRAPFLIMQGTDDVICPPSQTERFLARVTPRPVPAPHVYLTFPGEGHGFRRRDTISVALEAELAFYARVFGFDPPGVKPLDLTSGGR